MADDANKIDDEDVSRSNTDVESRGSGATPPSSDEEDVPRSGTDVESRDAGRREQTQTDDEEDTPRG